MHESWEIQAYDPQRMPNGTSDYLKGRQVEYGTRIGFGMGRERKCCLYTYICRMADGWEWVICIQLPSLYVLGKKKLHERGHDDDLLHPKQIIWLSIFT